MVEHLPVPLAEAACRDRDVGGISGAMRSWRCPMSGHSRDLEVEVEGCY